MPRTWKGRQLTEVRALADRRPIVRRGVARRPLLAEERAFAREAFVGTSATATFPGECSRTARWPHGRTFGSACVARGGFRVGRRSGPGESLVDRCHVRVNRVG